MYKSPKMGEGLLARLYLSAYAGHHDDMSEFYDNERDICLELAGRHQEIADEHTRQAALAMKVYDGLLGWR